MTSRGAEGAFKGATTIICGLVHPGAWEGEADSEVSTPGTPRPSVSSERNIRSTRQQCFPMTHPSFGSLRSVSLPEVGSSGWRTLWPRIGCLVQIPTLTSEAAPLVQATLLAT